MELRLPPPQAPRFSRKAGEAGEPVARETEDEHARDYGKEKEWLPFPFPSSLAHPPLSQRGRRQGTRQELRALLSSELRLRVRKVQSSKVEILIWAYSARLNFFIHLANVSKIDPVTLHFYCKKLFNSKGRIHVQKCKKKKKNCGVKLSFPIFKFPFFSI